MPSLTDVLNVDILTHILFLLYVSSKNTLKSTQQVNRQLHDLSQPLLHREITLDFTSDRAQKRLDSFLSDQNSTVFWALQKLIVVSTAKASPFVRTSLGVPIPNPIALYEAKWRPLAELIERVKNLKEVVFDCREIVPIVLLEALHQHHPAAYLHVKNWTRTAYHASFDDPHDVALAASPCLRSLQATFVEANVEGVFDFNIPAFLRVIAMAPNIESASLENHLPSSGVFVNVTDEEMEDEEKERDRFHDALRAAALRALKDIRFPWFTRQIIADWENFIDLSRLKTLAVDTFDWGALTPADASRLRALRSLSLGGYTNKLLISEHSTHLDALLNFVCALPPLESLTLPDPINLERVLGCHGQTLRSLCLHQPENTGQEDSRNILSIKALEQLREMAPHLESLRLDIDRSEDKSSEGRKYSVLSTFPALRSITLHYDLGLYLVAQPGIFVITRAFPYPRGDQEFSRQVWSAIQQPKLEELNLTFGEPHRYSENRYFYEWQIYERDAWQTFNVRRSERDDQPDEVTVEGEEGGQESLMKYIERGYTVDLALQGAPYVTSTDE